MLTDGESATDSQRATALLSRPLPCLRTATQQAAVAASFLAGTWHGDE